MFRKICLTAIILALAFLIYNKYNVPCCEKNCHEVAK